MDYFVRQSYPIWKQFLINFVADQLKENTVAAYIWVGEVL